ncbi:hypothetical protein [Streptomyces sp. NBC_00162]|uniref:hypothetical protein n=1 Tax=Streptomyces sp. NBC_00162 TaxID=2903629 RepID=UPI00214BE3DD|nr:hypothetical protein [Streptomyces sp. NBC_00162]UUU38808.1 hypothetical protein JIW86_08325 [Streptomyces sp. NBC_00162]
MRGQGAATAAAGNTAALRLGTVRRQESSAAFPFSRLLQGAEGGDEAAAEGEPYPGSRPQSYPLFGLEEATGHSHHEAGLLTLDDTRTLPDGPVRACRDLLPRVNEIQAVLDIPPALTRSPLAGPDYVADRYGPRATGPVVFGDRTNEAKRRMTTGSGGSLVAPRSRRSERIGQHPHGRE